MGEQVINRMTYLLATPTQLDILWLIRVTCVSLRIINKALASGYGSVQRPIKFRPLTDSTGGATLLSKVLLAQTS